MWSRLRRLAFIFGLKLREVQLLVVDIQRFAELVWGWGRLEPVDLAKALFELEGVREEPFTNISFRELCVLYSLAFEHCLWELWILELDHDVLYTVEVF